jgi:hypothetical protein
MRVNFVEVWRRCDRRRHRYDDRWQRSTSSSLAAFARAKYFAINVLTADQRELSQRFSSTVADKFDGVGAAYGGKKRQVAPWASLDKSRCKGETGRAEPCSRLRAGRVLF